MPAETTPSEVKKDDRPYIGGQAVLEGVMMRSPKSYAVACRRADGSISIKERPFEKKVGTATKLPLVRGVMSLVESLRLGSDSLKFSAALYEQALEAEEQGTAKPKGGGIGAVLSAFGLSLFHLATKAEGDPAPQDEEKRGFNPMALMTVVAVLFLVALPQLLAYGTSSVLKMSLDVRSVRFQLLTGLFKLVVVVGYLLLIRQVADIRRVFQYHGAEHKTISTYEAKKALTVDNARSFTTLHPRCGTTFLVMTVLVSILVWTALGPLLPRFGGSRLTEQLLFFLMKLPALPLLAGITFELQRFTARYCLTGPLRALLWPGFVIQKITTIEPDDAQLEIALASLRATLWREEVGTDRALPKGEAEVLSFPSYGALCEAPGLRDAA